MAASAEDAAASAGRVAASAEDAAASRSVVSAEDAAASRSVVSAEDAAASAEVATVPEATPEELVAILAAYEALWPAPRGATAPPPSPAWRYAGRPWRRRRAWGGWC